MDECVNYYIEDINSLGRGGFGEVFKVNVHNRTKKHTKLYARKYFSPSPDMDKTPIREIADLRQRFIVEIRTQCRLNARGYDFIAPIVLFNTNGDKPYFIMELAEGNLRDAINTGIEDKTNAIISILKGVKLIHENNYIHRDLKPENILIYKEKERINYKISDFGLVKDLDTIRAEIKTKFRPNGMGTDGYRAPEINDSGTFTQQTDIYAVGKIISDIYAGNAPSNIREIVSKCTNYFPEDRYNSTAELLDLFVKISNKSGKEI